MLDGAPIRHVVVGGGDAGGPMLIEGCICTFCKLCNIPDDPLVVCVCDDLVYQ